MCCRWRRPCHWIELPCAGARKGEALPQLQGRRCSQILGEVVVVDVVVDVVVVVVVDVVVVVVVAREWGDTFE